MAKGENIFRRRDGRWEARYIKGRELSGKIKYGYCYGKTYREAKEKAAKRKAALANGVPLLTSRTQKPFSSYCLEWLHTKKCTVKESTYIKYSTAVNKHIMPKLGECCSLGFTTELMDDFIKELQFEDELAPKTVHDILVVLHGILKFASSKFAGSFPAVEINYPKIGKKEMRVLSREEQARLVAYLHEDLDSCRFGILLALCTGIRIGELCALQWESVSTNDKAIRIAKTLQRLHDTSVSQGARTRIVIGPPKSDTSVRTIPMTEYATGLCRRMKPQSSAAYVLTGTEAFMEPRTLQYRLEKYTQACGLEGVHFHTLRHTFATRAVEVGFEVKSLSEILGHASVTITLDRYGKPFMIYKFRSMRLDAEENGPQWADEQDPRCTRFGQILRRTRLDELPQFYNILRGDMSFVGPRPERAYFYGEFEKYIPGFSNRLIVVPGLTGHAQVNGGYSLKPEEKIIYDMEYIEKRSIWMDLACIGKTIRVVLCGAGAR